MINSETSGPVDALEFDSALIEKLSSLWVSTDHAQGVVTSIRTKEEPAIRVNMNICRE